MSIFQYLQHVRRRLQRLEVQKQKLIDAYLADAITVDDLKPRQEAVLNVAAEARGYQKRTPSELSLTRGSNINHLAERARFELAVPLLTRRFSRPFP